MEQGWIDHEMDFSYLDLEATGTGRIVVYYTKNIGPESLPNSSADRSKSNTTVLTGTIVNELTVISSSTTGIATITTDFFNKTLLSQEDDLNNEFNDSFDHLQYQLIINPLGARICATVNTTSMCGIVNTLSNKLIKFLMNYR